MQSRPIFALSAAAFAIAIVLSRPAAADMSHDGHGMAGHGYSGHAAALGEPGDPAAQARTVSVEMNDDMRFAPAAIAVQRGETIRFVVRNVGAVRHEMTLGTMAEFKEHAALMEQHPGMQHADPNAVSVEPGSSGTILWHFTKAGRFDFACLEPGHMQAGMIGRITVR